MAKTEPIAVLPTSFTGAINSVVFSNDGSTLASGHYDGAINIWNPRTGQLLRTIQSKGVVESLAFSPDGILLAAGYSYVDNNIRIYAIDSGELLRTLEGHVHAVEYLSFAPNGQSLASASYDGSIRLWGLRP